MAWIARKTPLLRGSDQIFLLQRLRMAILTRKLDIPSPLLECRFLSLCLFWLPSLSLPFALAFLRRRGSPRSYGGIRPNNQQVNKQTQKKGKVKDLEKERNLEFWHRRSKEKDFVGVALESDQSDAGSQVSLLQNRSGSVCSCVGMSCKNLLKHSLRAD